MKKIFYIAKANIFRQKRASVSLFIIIMIASMLATIGLSIFLGIDRDFKAVTDRSNNLHSAFIMTRDMYNPSFEDALKSDSRVSQYEISEVLFPRAVTVDYGGDIDLGAIIFNLETPVTISPPKVTEEDLSIPREQAIYLPVYAKSLGYKTGDIYTMDYKNRLFKLTIAGFFESNDFSTPQFGTTLKHYAPGECYELLEQQFGSPSVWIAVRMMDIADSGQFNRDFAYNNNYDLMDFSLFLDSGMFATIVTSPVAILSAILLVFAALIVAVSLFVIRFRITSGIEDTMHEIGVLKASGYTSTQIIASYIAEYSIIAFPAALLGIAASIPVFPLVRQAMTSTSGFIWSIGADIGAGMAAALVIVIILLLMALRACGKIKELQPVNALRGGISTGSFRRNFFPLGKGAGGVNTRLGLKNIFVYIKTYIMVGAVIAVMSLTAVFMGVLYQNMVIDQYGLFKIAGFEIMDAQLTLTRHTDAEALAAELEKMPEVRKTSNIEGMFGAIGLEIEDVNSLGYLSDDFGRLENMHTHDGRFPKYDNEVAVPKIFADQLGKKIGDIVVVKASGVSQEYIITGFFSSMSYSGRIGAMTYEGYRRLNPNYAINTVSVYFSEGVTFDEFSESLKRDHGVLNVYKQDENSSFAAAKAVAEEKISNYIELYDIDSVEYAVIYNGDVILSGASGDYQIEKITDVHEWLGANVGTYAGAASLTVWIVTILALIIISMIISMTVQSIIAKRHRELGTLKALGFTTKQLARQLAISFMPCAAIGVVAGCGAGGILAGPAITKLFASTGAYGSAFAVSPVIVIIIGAVFLVVTFAVANMAAGRTKDISAYDLISDMPAVKNKGRNKYKNGGGKAFGKSRAALPVICALCFLIAWSPIAVYGKAVGEGAVAAPAGGEKQEIYGIGSVSKVFAAAAVMKLAEDGAIDLDAPVAGYIPEFELADERYVQITPRMLLNHSSGLMGGTFNNGWLLGDNDTYYHDNFLNSIKNQTLKHDPGERSIYCNDGFTLAEILVERVSGLSFTEFLQIYFLAPLGLENTETSQSDFDRGRLAGTYMGDNSFKAENTLMIGSGGVYATVEDLCRYATIFMDSADGSVLSRQSVDEMAKNQHKNEMIPQNADTTLRYGLGWDSVETYPYSQYGIKALSKGGGTCWYHSNLTVLPEYNLAAAVASSGGVQQEELIVQEIILAVLKEVGILDDDAGAVLPVKNLERAGIPENLKSYAGVYSAGKWGSFNLDFGDDTLILTPIMVRNERPMEFIYNTDGEFVSINNDYLGQGQTEEGVRRVTILSFAEDKYIIAKIYEQMPGLSTSAMTMPFAEKLESSMITNDEADAWKARNDQEYLLVSDKYTSVEYIRSPIAKTLTDERLYGYVGMGIYQGSGLSINLARIMDENTALGFQSIPTMTGRDTNNLYISKQNGNEYLGINNYRYINAASAKQFSETGDSVVIGSETLWFDIDSGAAGKTVHISTPQNGAWFVYDKKMNCIASSLETRLRETVILPENGRLAFAGEQGAEFMLK